MRIYDPDIEDILESVDKNELNTACEQLCRGIWMLSYEHAEHEIRDILDNDYCRLYLRSNKSSWSKKDVISMYGQRYVDAIYDRQLSLDCGNKVGNLYFKDKLSRYSSDGCKFNSGLTVSHVIPATSNMFANCLPGNMYLSGKIANAILETEGKNKLKDDRPRILQKIVLKDMLVMMVPSVNVVNEYVCKTFSKSKCRLSRFYVDNKIESRKDKSMLKDVFGQIDIYRALTQFNLTTSELQHELFNKTAASEAQKRLEDFGVKFI